MSEPSSDQTHTGKRPRRSPLTKAKAAIGRLQELVPGNRARKGATVAIILLAVVVGVTGLFGLMANQAPNPVTPLVFLVMVGLLVLLGGLVAVLLPWLGWTIRQIPRGYVWAATVTLVLLAAPFGFAIPGGLLVAPPLIVCVSLVGAGVAVLWKSGWRRLERIQLVVAVLGLVIGAVGLVGSALWIADDGRPIPPPANAAKLGEGPVEALDLPNPAQPGSYRVRTYTYGTGEDLHRPAFGVEADFLSEPVDGSPFVRGWSGLDGRLRTNYWGFDAAHLPLNGRVWAPEGEGSFPLVLMVHGQHMAEDFSDAGYAYLGELLASRGMIAVSVDENFLNGSSFEGIVPAIGGLEDENDARGWLLLEHLRQWRDWNRSEEHPFYRKVDLDRIALIGHSRGGEAVAVAAAFNRLPAYPDNAHIPFSYRFNIRSAVAIAPVEGQYKPTGVGTPLENISYFTLHGTHDSDIGSFEGEAQYERVHLHKSGPWFKSYLYVYGANHGQFNTTWGRADFRWPESSSLNLRNLMPPADQERIAKLYVSAFMEATLHDHKGYRVLFSNPRAGQAWRPDTIYLSGYQDTGDHPISTYEEDIDVESTTLRGGRTHGENLTNWREKLVRLKFGPLESSAVYLGWNRNEEPGGHYRIELPDKGLSVSSRDALIFSLADGNSNMTKPLDLTVELVDQDGNKAHLPLSWVMPLQPSIEVPVKKAQFLSNSADSEMIFQDYAFPLADFRQENRAFDPTALKSITFVFDRSSSGLVLLDNLGVRKAA